ncbi:MAG: hypothetical protein JSR59_04465 [Proteobacteria bacterium]|nr:hypothetical protein [Pseudomonadota bacterium]
MRDACAWLERLPPSFDLGLAALYLAELEYELDHMDAALASYRRARRCAETVGFHAMVAPTMVGEALCLTRQGQGAEALRLAHAHIARPIDIPTMFATLARWVRAGG